MPEGNSGSQGSDTPPTATSRRLFRLITAFWVEKQEPRPAACSLASSRAWEWELCLTAAPDSYLAWRVPE